MKILIALIAYLLGSIPSAYLLGKTLYNTDVRTLGSGNVGTTNAFRNFGKKAGVLTFLIDFSKGFIAVLLANKLTGIDGIAIAALAVVIGHMYSIFLNFKAGKGVATAMGALYFINLKLFLILSVIFIIIVLTTKIVSLASVTIAVLMPFGVYIIYGLSNIFFAFLIISLLIIYKHKANINRLIKGTEPKIKKG